jgi:hypothetical protein
MTKKERNHASYLKRKAADPEGLREKAKLAMREWRAANLEKARATCRKSHAKYKDVYKVKYAPRQKAYRERYMATLSPEQKKDRTLRRKYGIGLDDYNRMWNEQRGCCPVCEQPFSDVRPPHVDHDHATKVVRAILCQHCNQAAGMVFEVPAVAERLAAYLRKHGKK